MTKDRNYQASLEDTILMDVTYRDLWEEVSEWFSCNDMVEFLERFADTHDIDIEEVRPC